jgi:hypothetical protein
MPVQRSQAYELLSQILVKEQEMLIGRKMASAQKEREEHKAAEKTQGRPPKEEPITNRTEPEITKPERKTENKPAEVQKERVFRIQLGAFSSEDSNGFVLTTVDELLSWGRRNALWPVTIGLACCAIEMMHAAASRFDLDRLGVIFRASPRQADLLIVAGTVVNKVAPMLKLIWEQIRGSSLPKSKFEALLCPG